MENTQTMPRAGDEVLAVDWEVACQIALLAKPNENANACLRRLLDLAPLDNARFTRWRRNMLAKHAEQIRWE